MSFAAEAPSTVETCLAGEVRLVVEASLISETPLIAGALLAAEATLISSRPLSFWTSSISAIFGMPLASSTPSTL